MTRSAALLLSAAWILGCGGTESSSPADAGGSGTMDAAAVPDGGAADVVPPGDAGCPVPNGGFVSLCGTFHALSLSAVDGIGYLQSPPSVGFVEAGVQTRFVAFVEDKSSLCASGAVRQGGTVFNIDLQSGSNQLGPGVFTVLMNTVPGNVDVSLTKLDSTCSSNSPSYAASAGTVTITSVDSATVQGTFDLVMQHGDGTLQGAFRVPLCAQLPASNGNCSP